MKTKKIKSIACHPRASDIRTWGGHRDVLIWKRAPAFNANPRGILIHRVRSGETFLHDNGSWSHDGVSYWCGGSSNGEGVNMTDTPPADRLLCARCEQISVENGELSAEKLTGRHVCIGVLKAFRLCCRNEGN